MPFVTMRRESGRVVGSTRCFLRLAASKKGRLLGSTAAIGAGYRAEQEPTAFCLSDRRLEVRAILDRWYSPTQRWFKVDADDGNVYVLRHDEASDEADVVQLAIAHRSELALRTVRHATNLEPGVKSLRRVA